MTSERYEEDLRRAEESGALTPESPSIALGALIALYRDIMFVTIHRVHDKIQIRKIEEKNECFSFMLNQRSAIVFIPRVSKE